MVLLFGLIFCVQNLAFAQNATLTNIIVTNTRDDLLVYLNVEGAYRKDEKGDFKWCFHDLFILLKLL